MKWDVSPNLELRKGNPRVCLKETNGRHDVLASLNEMDCDASMNSQNNATMIRDKQKVKQTPQREIPQTNSLFQSISVPVRAFCYQCQTEVITRVTVEIEELGFFDKLWSVFSVCCRGNKRVITHYCSSCQSVVSKINAFN